MTSVTSGTKQTLNDVGYYITVADCRGLVYGLTGNTLSTAVWASNNATSTLVSAAGKLLKDMGKTYISSSRVFRKIQAVDLQTGNGAGSTFGVNGLAGTSDGEDYFTGYIELGFEGGGSPAPVAHFGR